MKNYDRISVNIPLHKQNELIMDLLLALTAKTDVMLANIQDVLQLLSQDKIEAKMLSWKIQSIKEEIDKNLISKIRIDLIDPAKKELMNDAGAEIGKKFAEIYSLFFVNTEITQSELLSISEDLQNNVKGTLGKLMIDLFVPLVSTIEIQNFWILALFSSLKYDGYSSEEITLYLEDNLKLNKQSVDNRLTDLAALIIKKYAI